MLAGCHTTAALTPPQEQVQPWDCETIPLFSGPNTNHTSTDAQSHHPSPSTPHQLIHQHPLLLLQGPAAPRQARLLISPHTTAPRPARSKHQSWPPRPHQTFTSQMNGAHERCQVLHAIACPSGANQPAASHCRSSMLLQVTLASCRSPASRAVALPVVRRCRRSMRVRRWCSSSSTPRCRCLAAPGARPGLQASHQAKKARSGNSKATSLHVIKLFTSSINLRRTSDSTVPINSHRRVPLAVAVTWISVTM